MLTSLESSGRIKASISQTTQPLNIAYLFQSTGIQFSEPFAVQLHIYHLIRGLQKIGHRASLLALQERRVLYTADMQAVRSGRLRADHFVDPGLSGSLPYKLLESAVRRSQRQLRLPYLALFDSHRTYEACFRHLNLCDLIHERYNLMAIGGALASQKLGIPYVLEVNADLIDERAHQGVFERGLRRRHAERTTQFCFDTAQKIICVSSQLRDHLVEKWQLDAAKTVVLPNAADTEAFGRQYDTRAVRRKFKLEDEPVVMFVGGFYVWHDLDLLLDSFARVLARTPQAKLILVGDGRTRSQVELKIRRDGLQENVIMAGAIEHHQVPEMLAAADVAVAPNTPFFSGHGGSPLKLFEYMAAGKAIVATKTGQVAEVIRHGQNGLLADPGDVDQFAIALGTLLDDATLRFRLGQLARQEAVARYSWQHYASRLEEIYMEAIKLKH